MHYLRNRFGIPGVISVIALIFAMLGGAYAASNSSGGKATASAKAKKGPRGPKGATGPAGPAGANGKDGANGANGVNGVNGVNGANGATVLSGSATPTTEGVNGDFYIKTGASPEIFGPKTAGSWGAGTKLKGSNGVNGTDGNSVLNGAITPTTEGEEGDFYIKTGASPEIYGPKTGAGWGSGTSLKGPQGPEGNIGETLPPNVQMSGTWTAGEFTATAPGQPVFTNVSFNIPVTNNTTAIFMKEGESQSPEIPVSPAFRYCTGGVNTPTVAAPSNPITENTSVLCLFTSKAVNWDLERLGFTFGVTANTAPTEPKMGMVLEGKSEGSGVSYAYGTWVVKTIP